MPYELYYWPGLPGRGEFVRLAFEAAGADYLDIARLPKSEGYGMPALMRALEAKGDSHPPFAPPFIKDADLVVSQVANILEYLGPHLGLVPKDERLRPVALALQLTITDLVAEVHDTHHPIASSQTYEEQREPAKARAEAFRRDRIPKYLGYFERIAAANRSGWMVGDALTHVDLSMFQALKGLAYAFPEAMAEAPVKFPPLYAIARRVRELPRIAAYLASPRCQTFNETGIFRHYRELDGPAGWDKGD
ncbi:MAG: glutathione S-transferase family protein [Caulobacteraceae bacterium]|nr:glutathione S-transferase family protein [Caulobacteraceae bacterium]